MRLAIDFDNTIAINEWPEVGYAVPGSVDALKRLHAAGHSILIWSGRNNTRRNDRVVDRANGLLAMKAFLDVHDVPYDEIDYGIEGKPVADVYVDDKALGAPLTDFHGKRVVDWKKALVMLRLLAVRSRL